jgi:omega-hydroxy-beta-dihydromenaquinone-9 sulfotransferase
MVWHGMTFGVWLKHLARNCFAISPRFWPAAAGITAVSLMNLCCAWLQSLILGRRIACTEIREPPIFVLGHWRSGTTLLQQLLAQDERLAFPTAYDCFAPRSSLVTSWFVRGWLGFLYPKRRPMDNMAAGPGEPHEDEFALLNMGLPSPYAQLAFPNRPLAEELLDFDGFSTSQIRRWQNGLLDFVRRLTWRAGGRPIVLKSPPHTARIRWLLERFPNARFVHIVRDPRRVFPSTIWLWKSLYAVHGLQQPCGEGLDGRVFRDLNRMYRAFWEQKELIPPENLCEIRYEDLVREPVAEMERVYEQLRLGSFEQLRSKIEQYFERHQGYRTNSFPLDRETIAEITHQWRDFIQEYGYDEVPQPDAAIRLLAVGGNMPMLA